MSLSCSTHPYTIPVDEIEDVKVARFDSLVLQYVAEKDSLKRQELIANVGDFWGIYNYHLLGLKDAPDFYNGLSSFMNDTVVAKIYNDAMSQYADMSNLEQQLSLISARYRVLFPQSAPLTFQSHISALNLPIATLDSLISFSVDCYMGADYPLYPRRYNMYELPYRTQESLLPDIGEVLLRNKMPARQATLLDAMVYEGVIACLLSALLDDASSASVMRYTPEQEKWCLENELLIWQKIIEQSHLFTTDKIIINKYIQPAPFTATLTQDSPGRVGRWIGWRIVQEYVKEQGLTMKELAVDTEHSVEVLRLSNYDAR